MTKTITAKENTISVPNGDAYVFVMPNYDVTITAYYTKSTADQSSTGSSGSSGKTVGVGAAFALTYTSVTAEAGIGENRSVTAGSLLIKAGAEHELPPV